jgi:hypothetical protein
LPDLVYAIEAGSEKIAATNTEWKRFFIPRTPQTAVLGHR